MPDMLVKLYGLPESTAEVTGLATAGVVCRRAESFERGVVRDFVRARFPQWVDEATVGFACVPPKLFVGIENGVVVGFACFDVTRPNYFGPTGVAEEARGRGIGRVLLLQCLEALRAEGYAYAIIGGVGPAAFYEKAVGATIIAGSETGIYGGMLRRQGDAR